MAEFGCACGRVSLLDQLDGMRCWSCDAAATMRRAMAGGPDSTSACGRECRWPHTYAADGLTQVCSGPSRHRLLGWLRRKLWGRHG